MKVFKSFLFVAIICILQFLSACDSQDLTFENSQEMIAYIDSSENGFSKVKQEGNIKMKMTYRPTAYWVDKGINYNLDKPSLKKQKDSLENIYSKYSYFQLSISHDGEALLNKNKLNRNQYSTLLQKLSFRLNSFVELMVNNRTVELSDYRYENFYGLAKSDNVLLVFEKLEDHSGPVKISVEPLLDRMGKIEFEYDEQIFQREFLLKKLKSKR